jgi:hypothetical protein
VTGADDGRKRLVLLLLGRVRSERRDEPREAGSELGEQRLVQVHPVQRAPTRTLLPLRTPILLLGLLELLLLL